MRISGIGSFLQKLRPIVGLDIVQCLHQIIEGIGNNSWRATLTPVKCVAEIIKRLLAMALLTDDCVDFQPDQFPFRIVIEATSPRLPLRSLHAENLHRASGVFKRTPSAPRTMVESCRGFRQRLAILIRSPQARTNSQNIAEVLGKSF